MQFCPECGSMMHADGDEMVCSGCGATESKDESLADEYTSTEGQTFDDVVETEEGVAEEGMPTAKDVTCDRCGHDEAWYTLKQTASADEPPTRFFKCKECGYRWRGYN